MPKKLHNLCKCNRATIKRFNVSIFFAKLSTIIYLTNQVMIPESGITRRRHLKNVHRPPFFLSHPHTTLGSLCSPSFYFSQYRPHHWEPACSHANCNESICTFGTLQCALPHLGFHPPHPHCGKFVPQLSVVIYSQLPNNAVAHRVKT